MRDDYCIAYVTTATESEAVAIARALTAERLAACVNIISPIRSLYRWQGKTCDETEHLLIIKTRRALLERMMKRIGALHSYEVPEIIAVPIIAGLPAYLRWIEEETQGDTTPRKSEPRNG